MIEKVRLHGCKETIQDNIMAGSFFVLFSAIFSLLMWVISLLENTPLLIIAGFIIVNLWYLCIRMVNNGMIDTWNRKWRRLPYFTDLFEWSGECNK